MYDIRVYIESSSCCCFSTPDKYTASTYLHLFSLSKDFGASVNYLHNTCQIAYVLYFRTLQCPDFLIIPCTAILVVEFHTINKN